MAVPDPQHGRRAVARRLHRQDEAVKVPKVGGAHGAQGPEVAGGAQALRVRLAEPQAKRPHELRLKRRQGRRRGVR